MEAGGPGGWVHIPRGGSLPSRRPRLAARRNRWLDKDIGSMLIKSADDTESLGRADVPSDRIDTPRLPCSRTPCRNREVKGDGGVDRAARGAEISRTGQTEEACVSSAVRARTRPGTSPGAPEAAACTAGPVSSRDMVSHACPVCGEGRVHCQAPPVEVTCPRVEFECERIAEVRPETQQPASGVCSGSMGEV